MAKLKKLNDGELSSVFLNGKDPRVKINYLQAFIVDPPCAMTQDLLDVIQELRNEKDPGVRFWAKKVFARFSADMATPVVDGGSEEDSFTSSGDVSTDLLFRKLEDVKKSTFNALKVLKKICETKNPAVLEPLLKYLKATRDTFQISYLTKQIGIHFPSDTALPVLCNFLSHHDPRIIANTIEGLEGIGTPKSFAICARFLKHTNNRVRANAAKAVSHYDSQKAQEIILKMLGMRHQPHIVISACYAVRELREAKYFPYLTDLLNDDLILEDAMSAMVAIDKTEAVNTLADFANKQKRRQDLIAKTIKANSSVVGNFIDLFDSQKAGNHENPVSRVISSNYFPAIAICFLLLIFLPFGLQALKQGQTSGLSQAKSKLEEMRLPYTQQEFIRCLEANRLHEAELFIQAGMDVNIKNKTNATPLHFCSYFGQERLIDLLVDAKAEVNAQDDKGLAPLHLASNQTTAEKLIKAGAAINIKNKQGKTPLHRCVENGNLEVAELLLRKGANVDIQDADGNTPLHLAAYSRQKSIVNKLVAQGAKLDVRNREGKSPRDLGV